MTAETLPIAQRLALSYAPAEVREDVLSVLLLDERLGAIVRGVGEVMIAQIKLAWWRERLGEDPQRWPRGEPLLERLQASGLDAAALVPMVDGWEHMLVEQPSAADLDGFAAGRAAGWECLCADGQKLQGVVMAARQWALADLCIAVPALAASASEALPAMSKEGGLTPLPRKLRSLAVLRALALRAVNRKSAELLDGPGAALLALRVGIFGR